MSTLAIEGGTPTVTSPMPGWPIHGERERELLLDVLDSGHWCSITGSKVDAFSDTFARLQGSRYTVCTSSGTTALEATLEALGIGPGDEVITSAYTFIATASAILAVGATPVFVDIDPRTNTIDPARIEPALSDRTRAIIPVHIAGIPADMDRVMAIAADAGIPVIEDACQAVGAQWNGKGAGTIGRAGCFSFQESKNLAAGEGGAVVTNDAGLFDTISAIQNTGRNEKSSGVIDFARVGRNLRMTEWQGAMLLAQLERLEDQMAHRSRSADRLNQALEAIDGFTPMRIDQRITRCAWHLYQFNYDASSFDGRDREAFIAALNAEGVPAMAGYIPLPRIPTVVSALSEHRRPKISPLPIPHAEAAGANTVWLPQNLLLADADVIDQVAAAFTKVAAAWQ